MMKQQLMDGGRVEIRGFGSFEMREYGGYRGRNPKTGDSVEVKPKRTPFFKPGQELKIMVNGKKCAEMAGEDCHLPLPKRKAPGSNIPTEFCLSKNVATIMAQPLKAAAEGKEQHR